MTKIKLTPREKVLHDQFTHYGCNAKEWLRKCALLLPEIDRKGIWKKKGFSCLYEYAAKLAGMSNHSVREALRVIRCIEDKPALMKIALKKGINAVRPVVTIATKETQEMWAEKVGTMSKHTLEIYVREIRKQNNRLESHPGVTSESEKTQKILPPTTGVDAISEPDTSLSTEAPTGADAPTGAEAPTITETLTMNLDPELAAELKQLKGTDSWNALLKELLELRRAHLEEKKPEPVRTESRHIPNPIHRWVIEKTRGQCGYPGCPKPYFQLHHTQRWALDKIHDPDRIIPLCRAHNEIAHRTLIANEELQPPEWRLLRQAPWWDLKTQVDRKVASRQKMN